VRVLEREVAELGVPGPERARERAVRQEREGSRERGGRARAVDGHGAQPGRDAPVRLRRVVELADEAAVRSLRPDPARLARYPVRGVIVTARAADSDFVSRFFAPASGIPEDPVTGSAHCALAPYWAAKLGRTDLVGFQASARGGRVTVSVRGSRVVLGGTAVTVLRGALAVPVDAGDAPRPVRSPP
jgi:hypothetical protein